MVYDDGSALAQFRRYVAPGDPNVVANWTAAVDIGYTDSPSLASGPLGLFMLSGTQTNAMTVRRFDGATFAAPVQVLPSGEDIQSWLTQDPAGRLHAVIPQGAADGLHLVHATSDDGAAWRSGTVLVQTDGGIFDVRSAVAADHVGVAVWWRPPRFAPARSSGSRRSGPMRPSTAPREAGLPRRSQPPATAVRLANGSVRVVVKGVLRRPAGVSRSRGCRGTVRVRFKRGKRAIGAKTVNVTQTCAFRRKLLIAASKVRAARKLAMTVRFNGNAAMAPAARTYTLPIKRRR